MIAELTNPVDVEPLQYRYPVVRGMQRLPGKETLRVRGPKHPDIPSVSEESHAQYLQEQKDLLEQDKSYLEQTVRPLKVGLERNIQRSRDCYAQISVRTVRGVRRFMVQSLASVLPMV